MSAAKHLQPGQFGEPEPVTYDRNIKGEVTAHLPGGRTETAHTWLHPGLTQLRHPEDRQEPMYHGTPHEISGEIEAGHPGNFARRMSHVYMTSHLASAENYAQGPKGHIYEVQPTSWYGHRRDAKGDNWASSHPLRIVREVGRDEVEKARRDWDKELGQ